ncbi:MAG: SGNH/GDSL hydrolase family protein [Lachnospiraceae bacterium]|nr:SGNH/GDSL hydrolase family protein [Lachnospiraceae bacterium]
MKSKKKTFRMGIIIVIIFFSVLSGIYFYPSVSDRILLQKDLKRFSQDTYDSVFLSMHSPSGYTKENFLNYNGLHTSVSSREIQSMEELQCYLEKIFTSGNTVSHVFLLLDPDIIWNSCNRNDVQWGTALQKGLFTFVSDHPDTAFEILLPYPSLTYLLNMDEAALEDILAVYSNFIEDTYVYSNICTFYTGFEKWLLVNPDNYISDFVVNDAIAKKIHLTCFCDKINQITSINAPILFDMLREQVIAERTSPAVYPDLSNCCLVFFGDSIMAYGEGTISTPGYITGFSHAVTYNYAIGGTAASAPSSNTDDFPNFLPRFFSEYCTEKNGVYHFSPDGGDISDKKLYFLINYGANDYFNGAAVENPEDPYDTTTYMGGLRSCLKECMTAFPDAEFIIMTPGYTSYFSNGTEQNSDNGGILTDYVEAAILVAEELDIYYMNNYHDLGVDSSNVSDYTADGCHPNENGRILMAEHIIDFIDNL